MRLSKSRERNCRYDSCQEGLITLIFFLSSSLLLLKFLLPYLYLASLLLLQFLYTASLFLLQYLYLASLLLLVHPLKKCSNIHRWRWGMRGSEQWRGSYNARENSWWVDLRLAFALFILPLGSCWYTNPALFNVYYGTWTARTTYISWKYRKITIFNGI